MGQNKNTEEAKQPKIVATAYLPTSKELRFVYDKVLNGTQGCNYLIEGVVVAFIPFSIPIMFETYTEQNQWENMQRKIRETPMVESPEYPKIIIEGEFAKNQYWLAKDAIGLSVSTKNHIGATYHPKRTELLFGSDIELKSLYTHEEIADACIKKHGNYNTQGTLYIADVQVMYEKAMIN